MSQATPYAIYRKRRSFASVRLYAAPLRLFSGILNLIGETGTDWLSYAVFGPSAVFLRSQFTLHSPAGLRRIRGFDPQHHSERARRASERRRVTRAPSATSIGRVYGARARPKPRAATCLPEARSRVGQPLRAISAPAGTARHPLCRPRERPTLPNAAAPLLDSGQLPRGVVHPRVAARQDRSVPACYLDARRRSRVRWQSKFSLPESQEDG
jgi:hypothetical protein